MSRGLDRPGIETPANTRGAAAVSREDLIGRQRSDRLHERARTLPLSESERAALTDIGRFRTIHVGDLKQHIYGGQSNALSRDLHRLTALGLVQQRTAIVDRGRAQLRVLVLAKAGKEQAERAQSRLSGQAFYSGFVKPSEVAHDAAIYRMYQEEAARIRAAGGRIERVVLDFELKKNIYSPLAKLRHLAPPAFARKQEEVARTNGLRVVDGKIPLPDLRIEFEAADGARAFIDLELATHHYHASHLRTKIAAGFKLFSEGGGNGRTAPHEERERTADILAF